MQNKFYRIFKVKERKRKEKEQKKRSTHGRKCFQRNICTAIPRIGKSRIREVVLERVPEDINQRNDRCCARTEFKKKKSIDITAD